MSPLFRAVVGYFFAAIIVTFPLVLSLDKSLSDPVDPVLNSWILAWEHYALLNEPGELFNANIFYPYKNTLLYSETLLLPSLLLLPIQIAGANAVLIHNLLVLLGFTLTGISGYLLGRWLFRNAWSGWLLGGIFAFNSYTLSNIGQAQLLHLEWLPLALLYLGKLLRVPTVRSAALLAAFLTAQFYTTIYYGIFGFLLIALVGGVVWLFMDYARVEVRWRALVLLACAIGLALLLCLPLGVRYYEVSQANHFYRTLSEAWPFSASFENWLAAPPNNLTWGWYFAKDLPVLGAYQIDALFPGIILALAAITGLALWLAHALTNKGRRGAAWRWPLLLLLALLFFFVLSFGPYFQRESLQPDFAQRLPYAWIHEWVPGFSALRAPVRFATTVYLGLATLVAYLAYRMRRRIHRMALLMLIAVEAVAVTPMTTFVPAATSDLQQAQRWLAEQPRGAYLELPIYSFAGEGDELQWLESQFQSINHWHASPFGYSGFFPPRHFELHDFLTAFPRKEVVAFLQASGIEWVVMQPAKMSADEWPAIQEAAKERGWQLQHWGEVWLLQLPNVPVQEPQVSYHVPEVAQRGGVVTIGAVFVSDQPVPVVADSDLGSVKAEWWQGERRVLTASSVDQPPYYVERFAVMGLPLSVPDVAGTYTLKLYRASATVAVAAGVVNVIEDVAPPERMLLPWRAVEANIVCREEEMQIAVIMQTVGWYDQAFTLTGRIVDGAGMEITRSAADVQFVPERARSLLLSVHEYTLPVDALPVDALPVDALPEGTGEEVWLDLIGYRWQQDAERIVPGYFIGDDGRVLSTLHLPIGKIDTCN